MHPERFGKANLTSMLERRTRYTILLPKTPPTEQVWDACLRPRADPHSGLPLGLDLRATETMTPDPTR